MEADQIRTIAAEAAAQAVAADRQRAAAIRTHAEAKGRETLADHLAFNTGMTVEEAVAVLTASPKSEAEPSQRMDNGFAAAMAATQNPNVGADNTANTGSGTGTQERAADRVLADFQAFTGAKVLPLKRS